MSDSDDCSEDVKYEEYAKFRSGKHVLRTCSDSPQGVLLYNCFYCPSQHPKPLRDLLAHAQTKRDKVGFEGQHKGLELWIKDLLTTGSNAAIPVAGNAPSALSSRSDTVKQKPILTKQSTQGNHADATVWPPVVILANIPNLSEEEIGNREIKEMMDGCCEEFNFDLISKSKMHHAHGRPPTGKAFVVFQESYEGYQEADHFSKILQRMGRGKDEYERMTRYTKERSRQQQVAFGWLATVKDMEQLDRAKERVKRWGTVPLTELRSINLATKRKAEEMEQKAEMYMEMTEHMARNLNQEQQGREELSQRLASEMHRFQDKENEVRQECRQQIEAAEQKTRQQQAEIQQKFNRELRDLWRAKMHLSKENERLAELVEQKQAFEHTEVQLKGLHHQEKLRLEDSHKQEMKELEERHQLQHAKLAKEARRVKEANRELQTVESRLSGSVKLAQKHSKARADLEAKIKELREDLAKKQENEEYLEDVANTCTVSERLTKDKLSDFDDACVPAMKARFLAIKDFGQVDLQHVYAAYHLVHEIKPDGKRKKGTREREAHDTCLMLQKSVEREIFEWNPKVIPRKNVPGKFDEHFDLDDTWPAGIRNTWGERFVNAVLEERRVCYKYMVDYPCSKPWDEEKKCKLTPAQAVTQLTHKLTQSERTVEQTKKNVESIEARRSKLSKQKESLEKTLKRLKKTGSVICEKCNANAISNDDAQCDSETVCDIIDMVS
ncbi:hypothetical protein CYMTET_50996 [Cymbomonas tetramitiformis]|uniref:XS domain-containing protein n=1 Tax=Cymbomonas tetramitiformis TaxID=36881 RepID=A0AAE0EU73_9CHLO|nr:hypothetical protein CYMTET_50996 [Cymbomonas tetramitiformis]